MMGIEVKDIIAQWLAAHQEEMLSDICTLCSIDSSRGEAADGAPYGEGPKKALMAAKAIFERDGFSVREYADRLISADLGGEKACLDILGHVDVVGAGEGWNVTEAFRPVVQDGKIYARGSSDDKGPVMAMYYAVRALKECGIPLSGRCRLILGSDEECGSSDLPFYYAEEEEAPMSFTGDAEFPLINVEGGRFVGTVTAGMKKDAGNESGAPLNFFEDEDALMAALEGDVHNPALQKYQTAQMMISGNSGIEDDAGHFISMYSGEVINQVPARAEVIVRGFEKSAIANAARLIRMSLRSGFAFVRTDNIEVEDPFSGEHPAVIAVEDGDREGELRIICEGSAAHASTPEKGVNAATLMLKLLSVMMFDDETVNRRFTALADLFPYGDHHGNALGLDISSDGLRTTVSPNIVRIDEEKAMVQFDARTAPVCDDGRAEEAVRKAAEKLDFALECDFHSSHVVPKDSAFVKTLLKNYSMVTELPAKTLSIGGGTYVHHLKNGVAFGAIGETTDTHMHGPDECMSVEELMTAALVYAVCIAELCA